MKPHTSYRKPKSLQEPNQLPENARKEGKKQKKNNQKLPTKNKNFQPHQTPGRGGGVQSGEQQMGRRAWPTSLLV